MRSLSPPSSASIRSTRPRLPVRLGAWLLVTALLVGAAHRSIPPEKVCPDFIQFWTAATLLVSGQDPYDPALQAQIQQGLGWKRAEQGLGVYDFLPYYYPPWLGLAFTPLLVLGYPLAKLTWLVLGAEFLLLSGMLLKDTVRGISPGLAIAVIGVFGFSIKAVAMGQVAPLVLLLVAASWWLLERRRDLAAGCVLALLTVKPQLTVLLLAAVLAWCVRQQRWPVIRGFLATLAALCVTSTAAWPQWLPSMLAATTVTPMPTHYYPGLGTTWFVVLRAVGSGGTLLLLAYAAVAIPLMLALVRTAVRRDARLEDVFGLALIAPFFLAPYARPYDFPVLLVPALTLMGTRLSPMSRAMMAAALIVLTALHIVWLTANTAAPVVGVRRPEWAYFWIPMLVALAWWGCTETHDAEAAPPHPPAEAA